jgi:hypothetical protein
VCLVRKASFTYRVLQEMRAAFLHYCKSSIKVSEMHLVHEGPFMAAQQYVQMCKDYKLLEPEGEVLWVFCAAGCSTTHMCEKGRG